MISPRLYCARETVLSIFLWYLNSSNLQKDPELNVVHAYNLSCQEAETGRLQVADTAWYKSRLYNDASSQKTREEIQKICS